MANEDSSSSSTVWEEEFLGADSGWVEARTSCDHLSSLCSDLSQIPIPDSPCTSLLQHSLNSPDPSSRRTGRSSPGAASKRKVVVRREVIGARFSSRSTPPSKIARVDNASKGDSPPVTFGASSLVTTRAAEPRVRPHQVASPIVSLQLATPSATAATTIPSAPRSCPPRSRTSTGAPIRAGPMVDNPLTIPERLGRFVLPSEVTRINALSTEGVIDTFLEGLAQVSTASVCLLSMARSHSQLKLENASMHKELSGTQGKIAALEAARRASEADLMAACERATWFETELSTAHKRAVKAEAELVAAHKRALLSEAELVKARERASLSEAELVKARERASLREAAVEAEMKAAHDRASQAEERAVLAKKDLEDGIAEAEKDLKNDLADAFIDGYEELRGKITTAFPDIDFSGFVPTEAPDNSSGSSGDDEDDGEDEGDSYESD